MECFCSFARYFKFFKKHSNYFCFIAFHLYRSILIWLYEIIVRPLENIAEKFLKNEPDETEWVHFYSLTTCTSTSDFGLENFIFDSMETYLCPQTNDFELFMQNEYELFLNHNVKQPKYNYEFEQIPEIIETLFVARKEDKYVFRTFPVLHSLPEDKNLCIFPEKSDMQFVILEYKHPKMYNKIELKIPDSYNLVGNEILSPAFIQRMLELQRSFYVFDFEYEVMLIDNDLECRKLRFNNYVKLEKNSYKICTTSSSETKVISKNEPPLEEFEKETDVKVKEEEKAQNTEEKNEGSEKEEIIETTDTIPSLSYTTVIVCCILFGSVIPLAQILNSRCGFFD